MLFLSAESTITLITLLIGLVGAIAALIPTLIKLVSSIKKIAKDGNWKKLTEIAMDVMKQVEEMHRQNPSMSSEDKLNLAIQLIKDAGSMLGIQVDDDMVNDLVDYIGQTISWVNEMKK